ncbi:MAG: type II toxin-antitoxin system HicA family toxin [bacterium]|nr:type II toxin-antitoxin system HicA family toxin [bacterium]
MPKTARLTAAEAEKTLLKSGFELLRSKGSHRIYFKNGKRLVIPFHGSRILHPKIVRQILKAVNEPAS